MKYSYITVFAFIMVFVVMTSGQAPKYDQNKEYNLTWIPYYQFNRSKLQMCEIISADGTYCTKCLYDIPRYDLNDQYGWCQLDVPVDNCYAPNSWFDCILCHDGYWLSITYVDINRCISKTVGCLNYDNNAKKCITCQPGWSMNSSINAITKVTQNHCYFVKDNNCANYDSNNICLSCVANYAVVSNRCVYWLPNCASMNGNLCQKCNSNYQLNSAGSCVAIDKIVNCASQLDYTCSACVSGYSLVNNQCVVPIENCATVNGLVCAKCNTGFAVTADGKCAAIPKVPNCVSQVDYTCESCVDGFALSNNQCIFVIQNCAQVNGLVCAQCRTGFHITTDGKCAQIPKIPNCASQLDFTCQSCATGFALTNNECVYIIENCASVNGFVCAQCHTGYFITTEGKCQVIPVVPYCASQVDFTCHSCVDGFALINNQCVFIIDNCAVVNGLVCAQCNAGFYINADGKCTEIPKVSNCASQIDFTCQSCATGFALTNNECVYIIENCASVNGLICAQCHTNFAITTDGKCSPIPPIPNCASQLDHTCQTCNTGYTIINNQCNLADPGCIEHTGTKCTKCSSLYSLSIIGICVPVPQIPNCVQQNVYTCNKCNTGYDLASNHCVYHIDNCLAVEGTVCSKCATGYVVGSTGLCVVSDPFAGLDLNCRLYDLATFNKCLACSGGFFLNANSRCQQVDPLCRSYNGKNGFCLNCYVGYSLDNTKGKCIKSSIDEALLNNCNTYDYVNNVCVKCAEGCYFDSTGKCLKFSDINCKTPSTDLKTCAQCYKGYTFDSTQNKCVIGDFHCATWNSNGRCATCPTGYYLDDSSNCILTDPYCKYINPINKQCIVCYPGYVLDVDKKCKLIADVSASIIKYTENCAKQVDGQCTDCYFGYYILKDANGPYCEKVNDLCKSYDKTNGKCTSCYLGYYLSVEGQCLRYF